MRLQTVFTQLAGAASMPVWKQGLEVVLMLIFLLGGIIACLWLINRRIKSGEACLPVWEDFDAVGFTYEQQQDIFVSKQDTWQRQFGYCELYDELAVDLSMVIQCEPVRFEYDGKEWLIEFWKGQYGITAGAEIGVYVTVGKKLWLFGRGKSPFYRSANDDELLQLRFELEKNGQTLFVRDERHWWLTGFRLGEFARPGDLTMKSQLGFPTAEMAQMFISGLIKNGYMSDEITVEGNTVSFSFFQPRAKQPGSQSSRWTEAVQQNNMWLCKLFNSVTGAAPEAENKLELFRKSCPMEYSLLINLSSRIKNLSAFTVWRIARKGTSAAVKQGVQQ